MAGLRTANLLNLHQLSVDVGLDQRTVTRYFEILKLTFQMMRILPWSNNTSKRLIKIPKIFMFDSAMACHLVGITEPKQIEFHLHAGPFTETWAFAEIRKLLADEKRQDPLPQKREKF